jgi:predicted O-methyltransferase YrrM
VKHLLQVSVVVGPANQGIEQLAKQGVRFDLAFLDADKGGYLGYYNQVARWLPSLAATCMHVVLTRLYYAYG